MQFLIIEKVSPGPFRLLTLIFAIKCEKFGSQCLAHAGRDSRLLSNANHTELSALWFGLWCCHGVALSPGSPIFSTHTREEGEPGI